NTKLSEDQLMLLAACDGEVDMASNKLYVLDAYTVKGDVSNATGNISFVGNLNVVGNVLTGFSIQADGNITVNGSVEDATVIAGGNIVVKEGIHGGGQGSVQAGGFIKSKYIQSGNVVAAGDIESTYIQHSNVQSNTNVSAVGTKGTLTGGRVVARNNITAAFIGGRNSAIPTTLEVGNNPATVEKYRKLEKEIETYTTQTTSLQQGITLLEGLEKEGKLDADRLEALNQARAAYQALGDSLAASQTEMEAIKEEIASLGFGSINGSKSIYPGVRIVIGSEQMLLETQYDYTSFIRGSQGIAFVPFQG
ncbi:MAG: FapA family protein, partial [Clostridiales bacterium]|nr:FapA family protein [Clostridiales bacterium]